MKKTNDLRKIFLAIAFFLTVLVSPALYAQTGFEDDVDDETPPEAPINGLLTAGLIAGAFLGYRFLKKGEQLS